MLERNRRVAKAYARAPVVTVNGSEEGFDGFRIGNFHTSTYVVSFSLCKKLQKIPKIKSMAARQASIDLESVTTKVVLQKMPIFSSQIPSLN